MNSVAISEQVTKNDLKITVLLFTGADRTGNDIEDTHRVTDPISTVSYT